MTDVARATTTVEQTVHIDASPATVWGFWTDPQRLTEWWAESAEVEPEPGGLNRVVMANGHISRGEFVEVTLRPEAAGTVLVLRHTLPVTHAEDHRKGWAGLVGDRLVAAAAAGG
jgi:uncharacterized protein YndB with AHSA1/START domain